VGDAGQPEAPKGQEATEHNMQAVITAVERILSRYECSEGGNEYVEEILTVVWGQKEADSARRRHLSDSERDLAAANARIAELTVQLAGAERALASNLPASYWNGKASQSAAAANARADAADVRAKDIEAHFEQCHEDWKREKARADAAERDAKRWDQESDRLSDIATSLKDDLAEAGEQISALKSRVKELEQVSGELVDIARFNGVVK
jgi:chromosome segregation ATPase